MADFELLGVGATQALVDGVKGYKQVTDAQIAALVRSLFTRTTPESHTHALTDATPVLAGLKVYGESTQDGTPTPSAPVEIVSVEPDEDGGVVLSVTGGGATVEIPIGLQNHALRSLPDGTRDEVTVDAGGNVTLVQRVGVATFDGSETWVSYGSSNPSVNRMVHSVGDRNMAYPVDTGQSSRKALSDRFPMLASGGTYSPDAVGFTISLYSGYTMLWVGTAGQYNSVSSWKAWLAENHMTLYYPLAVPQTIDLGQITPASLPAPELTAAIVPSAPSVLTVGRDPVAGFERLAASIATPDTSPATANHANNSLLMLDGQLCKCTAAIAVGETIAIGTNVAKTTLADVIAAL